jgi:hypothetical protein
MLTIAYLAFILILDFMRKPFLYLVICFFTALRSFGQAGAVFSVAGGGASTADGVPATSAYLSNTTGIGVDASGNIYVADRGQRMVKKIDGASGLIYTVAGNGTIGSGGDGGPATAAQLSSNIRGLFVDGPGNIYISDQDRIRRVDASTGIITKIAGGTGTAEGIPATTSSVNPQCVFVDAAGNVYTGSGNKVRRIDAATGLMYTIAGGGSSSADGIPATDAALSGSAKSLRMDGAGNLYIIDFGGSKIRRVEATTGVIYTVAGGGSSSSDGVPATAEAFTDFHNCDVDAAGNIFIADWNRNLIRRVDAATGIISTIAGVSIGGSLAEGTPALSAYVNPYMILADAANSVIYYTDFASKLKKFSFTPMVPFSGAGGSTTSDSFSVYVYKTCAGPQLTPRTASYHTGLTIRTYFGDGTSDTSAVLPALYSSGGYAIINHNYAVNATYSIMQVLINAGVPVDTLNFSYDHSFYSSLPVKFFADANMNCVKDGAEAFLSQSVITEVDSNGVPVDTVVATSGFNYMAHGSPGDVYRFRVLSAPASLYPSCPSTGMVYDTLETGVTTNSARWVGLSCVSTSAFDLAGSMFVPVTGPNDQWGHIYVRNDYCMPTDATVTLSFSPKYRYTGGANPAPVSSTPTSITWNLTGVSNDAAPRDIYYVVWHNPAVPYPTDGDTVNEQVSITPYTGDAYVPNNIIIRVDTVSTSCDPNKIEVTPGCYDNDTTFQFDVHFENIGSGPALNIYVMDTLSDKLDPSTLNFVMNTHPMFVTKLYHGNKTILRLDFPDINLADSSDHENCTGMFSYTIRPRPALPLGTTIDSRVGIYFDYNDVLMTNTAQNVKGCPPPPPPTSVTTIQNFEMALQPNPATDELTISISQPNYSGCAVINMLGQEVMHCAMLGATQKKLNVRELPAGVYTIRVTGSKGALTGKFVKQ